MNQPNLFDNPAPLSFAVIERANKYPLQPGCKSSVDTTIEAAEAIAPLAATLRAKALALIVKEPLTADEAAAALGEHWSNIRPRCSELSKQGLIVDTNQRRTNRNGKKQIVWRAA